MIQPLRLAIFDLDGTIVDSQHNIIAAVEEVARIAQLQCPPKEHIPQVIGLSLKEALAKLFPDVDPQVHDVLDHEYRQSFIRMRTRPDYDEPLFAGTHKLLDALDKEGILLGIATGKAKRGVESVLTRHKLTNRFVTIQTPDDSPGKPHPGMVLRCLAETGALPENTVVIGDTSYDIEMARAARVRAIGVSWGNHEVADLTRAGAHRLVDRIDDLLHAITELTQPAFAG